MIKIVLAGGTGLIGSNLHLKLKQKNYKVILLTTQADKADDVEIFYWNPYDTHFSEHIFSDADVFINLAGAPIFDKSFTKTRKKLLLDSRTLPNINLLSFLQNKKIKLPYFISASATGYYPNICSDILVENSTKDLSFVSQLVQAWEKSAMDFTANGTSVAILRFGIVFSKKGGFVKQLASPIRYGLGAIPGNGRQIISWVHIDDVTDAILFILEKKLQGIYNIVGDHPETLENIGNAIAKHLHRKIFLPHIPVWVLKLIFGERADLLLTSQHVSGLKLKQNGFDMRYKTIQSALSEIYP